MDFQSLHNEFAKMKITCNIKDTFQIIKFFVGSGGSHNIIIAVKDKNKRNLIIKIIPDIIRTNVKKKPDNDQLEIKFYQFFTKNYLLTDRTPHIVGIFNHQICQNIGRFIKQIYPKITKCPTYDDRLIKKIKTTDVDNELCDLFLRHEMKIIGPAFDIVLLEYCSFQLSELIESYMIGIKKTTGK